MLSQKEEYNADIVIFPSSTDSTYLQNKNPFMGQYSVAYDRMHNQMSAKKGNYDNVSCQVISCRIRYHQCQMMFKKAT